MSHVPGLRSPYAKVGRLVYFGRMLDKIRLHAAGKLPADEYAANLGKGFDGRCCNFLRVNYDELKARTLQGGLDDAGLLGWCEQRGGARTDEECEVWNGFMMKRGWRDGGAEVLAKRIRESKLESAPIMTMFDYLDFDEGRDPVSVHAWEPVRPAQGPEPAAGHREPKVIVIMGVSGCGKTTVGLKLAAALGWSFRDADDFHPPENVAKMSSGQPLTDRDRAPWLAAIRRYIDAHLVRGESAVVTCSALREVYRQAILGDPRVNLVHLVGSFDTILERMTERQGHFMKPEMLQSQFATLEAPQGALEVDIRATPDEIVHRIRTGLAI